MRVNPLITLDLVLSLSKDEGWFHGFSAACQSAPGKVRSGFLIKTQDLAFDSIKADRL